MSTPTISALLAGVMVAAAHAGGACRCCYCRIAASGSPLRAPPPCRPLLWSMWLPSRKLRLS